MNELINVLLHFDKYIEMFIANYGALTYVILFLIIFMETGLVVTPFLPGDSLIFAAATFAAKGSLNIYILIVSLSIAAILGDSLNYFIGNKLGHKLAKSRFIKNEHLEATEKFYVKHGGKAIIIARFIPIVRTFVPFVAGIGSMPYKKFLSYNIIGGICWVLIASLLGWFFGNIPFVKDNFTLVALAIIAISITPAIVTIISKKRKN